MNFESLQFPGGQSLTRAYIERTEPSAQALYGYHPTEPEHWKRRAAQLDRQASFRVNAGLLADALVRYNRALSASPKTISRIEALRDGALAVVGGQQAVLWTGPMMVIHKAVSIIQTARYAEERLGRPVVPVFWVAGEDHDWDEASHTYLLTSDPSLHRLAVPRPPGSRTSVSRTVLSRSIWESALQELAAGLPDTAFKPGLIETIRDVLKRSNTLTEQFAALLSRLFSDEGLVVLDADDPSLRKLEAPMFGRMIEENDALQAAYSEAAARVRSLGYAVQADVIPGSSNLFLFERLGHRKSDEQAAAGDRILLFKEGDNYSDRKGFVRLSGRQMLDIARHEPERLSNNVLTRPVMQDYLLPVLATVLGPGEIAYWGLTRDAFRLFGLDMPIVVPRMSFTLVDPAVQKHMIKYALTPEDVVHRFDQLRSAWLSRQDDLEINRRFDDCLKEIMSAYEPLLEHLVAVKPGLRDLAFKNKMKVAEQIEFMRSRAWDDERRKHDTALRQWLGIRLNLWPEGMPQERVLNFMVFWNRYGGDWLKQLLQAPLDLRGSHRLLYL